MPVEAGPPPMARIFSALALVAAASGLVLGLALRLWLVFHRPLTSDEAIVGLMAHQVLHGHFNTFYWGQSYGGVEPYVAAAWMVVVGQGPAAVPLVPAALCLLTAVVVWRVCLRVAPPGARLLAVTAGVAMWAWPEAMISTSTTEYGFRGVTLLTGVLLLLFAVRVTEGPSYLDLLALGLTAGVGWWASPEFAYFLVPAIGVLFAGRTALVRAGVRLVLVPAAFSIGALPWIVTNVRTGFLSLRTSSSPAYLHATYAGRLGIFFDKTLPMMLGLRVPSAGTWLWGGASQALYVAALALIAACVVAALARLGTGEGGGVLRAVAAGCVAFPFLFAVFPATSYWKPGQYGVYVVPLLVVLVTGVGSSVLLGRPGRRPAAWSAMAPGATAVVAVIALSSLSIASFDRASLPARTSFFSGWSGPSRAAGQAARQLQLDGIRTAYAEYWVAYDLDYLSHERLQVTDPYTDRWVAEYLRVLSAPDPAWLFFAPDRITASEAAFASSAPGPYGYPESFFLAKLARLKIAYRIEHAGVLDAVVPSRRVTPADVGIPAPYWR